MQIIPANHYQQWHRFCRLEVS